MEKYRIEFKRSAVKELRKISSKDLTKILGLIKGLEGDPRPSGCKKLSIDEKYRIRYRSYRILYAIEDDIFLIVVVKIGLRGKMYR